MFNGEQINIITAYSFLFYVCLSLAARRLFASLLRKIETKLHHLTGPLLFVFARSLVHLLISTKSHQNMYSHHNKEFIYSFTYKDVCTYVTIPTFISLQDFWLFERQTQRDERLSYFLIIRQRRRGNTQAQTPSTFQNIFIQLNRSIANQPMIKDETITNS